MYSPSFDGAKSSLSQCGIAMACRCGAAQLRCKAQPNHIPEKSGDRLPARGGKEGTPRHSRPRAAAGDLPACLRVSEAIGMRRDQLDVKRSRLWVERLKGSLSVEHPVAG